MKKVSIIVPAYNVEKYIDRCLNSLVNQTLDDIEIIIINDGSTDNTLNIINEYKKKYDGKLTVYNNENHGIGYTRNFGIKKSMGEYISFIDSDDYLDFGMIEKMYNKAKKEELDLVICNYHKMLEENNELREIYCDYNNDYFENTSIKENPSLLMNINLSPWNKLYKKEILKDIYYPENLKYEDAIFVIKSMINSKKIGIVPEELYYYVVRSKSETTVMDKRVFDILVITDMIIKEFDKQDYYNDIKEYAEAWCIRNLFRYTLQQKNQRDKIIANEFIDKTFDYLNDNFPNWRRNKIWKKRNILKRIIESNKILTKIYCKI